jgi:hypothetical protein
MADFGLFIGWGPAVRGREQSAQTVFGEAIEFWTRLQESGEIESWDVTFLEPHGGDLAGFFLVWGERDAIARIRASDDMMRLNARAQQIVENFGVVAAERRSRIETQMGWFLESAGELG